MGGCVGCCNGRYDYGVLWLNCTGEECDTTGIQVLEMLMRRIIMEISIGQKMKAFQECGTGHWREVKARSPTIVKRVTLHFVEWESLCIHSKYYTTFPPWTIYPGAVA